MRGIFRGRRVGAAFAGAALFAGATFAQPANNECSGAIPIVDGLNGPFSNAGATTSAPLWPCGFAGRDVWFSYVATCTGAVTFSLCVPGSATFDTMAQVFSGPCAGLVPLQCNDDFCGDQSQITVGVVPGAAYYVRIGGHFGTWGSFTLNVTCDPPPANDECAGAMPIVDGLNGPFSNMGATASTPSWAPCTVYPAEGGDVWFSYVATCTGGATFSFCAPGSATFNTIMQVFAGTCATLLPVACNNNSCGFQSEITVPVTSGTTYWVRVGGFSLSAAGSLTMNVTCSSTPTTFDFGDASDNSGLAAHNQFSTTYFYERLGTIGSMDFGNPVSPPWFGDDDDGIVSVSNLYPGSTTATIVVSAKNPNGSYNDYCRMWIRGLVSEGWTPSDALPIQTGLVGPNGTTFTFGPFTLPAAAAPSPVVRVRLSYDAAGVASPTGTGAFGEVEDYVLPGTGGPVSTPPLGSGGCDAGDAPLPYPPANSIDINGHRLGSLVTADATAPVGFPTSGVSAWNDDGGDDGIVQIAGLTPGGSCMLVVRATNPLGTLNEWISAWMDFDGDGVWDEAGEVFLPVHGPVGPSGATFALGPLPVPPSVVNPVATRIKISQAETIGSGHLASGTSFGVGEIEDYLLPATHGVGCKTAGGPISLIWADDEPRIGTTWALKHAQLVPGQAVTVIMGIGYYPAGLDIAAFGLPVPPGQCFLYPSITPLIFLIPIGAASGSGTVTWLSATPFDGSLVGGTLYFQSAQDYFAPGYQTARTPMLTATIRLP